MSSVRRPINIKIKRVVHRIGQPYFYVVWDFIIEGRTHPQGSNFPFSMS